MKLFLNNFQFLKWSKEFHQSLEISSDFFLQRAAAIFLQREGETGSAQSAPRDEYWGTWLWILKPWMCIEVIDFGTAKGVSLTEMLGPIVPNADDLFPLWWLWAAERWLWLWDSVIHITIERQSRTWFPFPASPVVGSSLCSKNVFWNVRLGRSTFRSETVRL